MSDINLLPEDLKKKQEKTLKSRGNFDLNEIEFTEGEKLKKEVDIKAKTIKRNRIGKWFKPKISDKSKVEKDYNKASNLDFVLKTDNKQKKFKKQLKSKKDFNSIKK